MITYDVIVIGGGAAGLMAAGQAAGSGARTLLLEKMDQPGRKIFITGKFRCNLTNTAPILEFIEHFGRNGRFLRQAFHQYFSDDLIRFFNGLNVQTITERGGRIFPSSGQSRDIVHALVKWCKLQGVEIRTHSTVKTLIFEQNIIMGVEILGERLNAKSVILATGGASYPGTGSTGDGYPMAKAVGHTIIPVLPALVPLITSGETAQNLQGLSLRNVKVSLWVDEKKSGEMFGEMLFTHFGVSGPIILALSRGIVSALEYSRKVYISIDLKPALNKPKLEARLLRDFDIHGRRQFHTMLKGLLPSKLIPVCIQKTGIPGDKVCHQITSIDRNRLLTWLKDFRMVVIGHRGFRHAIITAGGIDTREINPRTMESKLVKGLYFAGEIIDVDADTGGYNLQAAFSTGWVAGRSAVQAGE